MSKLYFRYGVMGSSKTAEALMCRFNYVQKGFNVLLLKSSIDNRFEDNKPQVISRIGMIGDLRISATGFTGCTALSNSATKSFPQSSQSASL